MILAILSGLCSLLLTLIGYFYNSWRNEIKASRAIYLQYLWKLELNRTILQQIRNSHIPIELACQQIQLLDPYTLCYIPSLDNHLYQQLLKYNIDLIVPLSGSKFHIDDIDRLLRQTKSISQIITSRISLIDHVIGKVSPTSFLCYLSIPIIIDKIVLKALSSASYDKDQKRKQD